VPSVWVSLRPSPYLPGPLEVSPPTSPSSYRHDLRGGLFSWGQLLEAWAHCHLQSLVLFSPWASELDPGLFPLPSEPSSGPSLDPFSLAFPELSRVGRDLPLC
jgi:hypothetical protein